MKSFMKEFKEFISKGSVMDLAVGMIIGSAFTAIVTALVDNIIMPLVGMIIGGHGVEDWSVTVGTATLAYGAFIQAIINFIIVGFVLFCIIKSLNKMKSAVGAEEEETPEETPADIELLTEIRDLLKK